MKCKICHDKLDPEHPDSIRGLSPLTFREAWMHYNCYKDAYQELSEDKKDRYDQKSA